MKIPNRTTERFLKLSVLLLIGFLMTGCLPDYYDGKMFSLPSPVLNSPTRGDETYLGGSFDYSNGTNPQENSFQGQLFIEHGYTGDFFSIAGHAEAYTGFYNVEAVESMKGENLQFYGFSPQLNASLFIPVSSVRFGVYALSGPYWEFGEYHDWLKEADEDDIITYWQQDSDTQFVFNGGLMLEHISAEDKMISFKVGVNSPVVYNVTTQFRSGNSIYTIGLSQALTFSYGVVW